MYLKNTSDEVKKITEKIIEMCIRDSYMEEVELLCDRVIILDKGKILATGTTDELKDQLKQKKKYQQK